MGIQTIAGAAFRALTVRKDGPSLYDVCDPVLLKYRGGDPHLGKFYRTALGNPALRPLLRRTGLPALRDEGRLQALREALTRARDEAEPDWAAVGAPIAELMADINVRHPQPAPAAATAKAPDLAAIEKVIRRCGAHLLRSFDKNGFIPTYAAFNLIGDPDMGGREMVAALTGLNSRGYKNSTLLFSLARIFIAHSPARALINPPWTGIAEPMWQPMQIRHRSAYYDAFFTEALLSYVETGLASADEAAASRRAIAEMVDFCLKTTAEEVPSHDGSTVRVVTALAPLPHPRFSKFFSQIKQDLGFGIYVPDCDTTACSFSAATQAGSTDPILDQPLLDFYRGYQVREGANEPRVTVPLERQCRLTRAASSPGSTISRATGPTATTSIRRSISTSSKSAFAISRAGRSSRRRSGWRRCIASSASSGGWWKAARSPIRARISITCRSSTRPISAAAMPRSWRCRRRRGRRSIPTARSSSSAARVLAYVEGELIAHEMNAFDAALALMALAHLGADVATFTPALHCIVSPSRRRRPAWAVQGL